MKLEWIQNKYGVDPDPFGSHANTVFGRYEILADVSRQSSHIYSYRRPGGALTGGHYLEEEAKAAAQADFDKRQTGESE